MERTRLVSVGVAAVLLLGACGDDDDTPTGTTADSPTVTTTTAQESPSSEAPALADEGALEGVLVIDGESVDVGRRQDSNNWCHYYEGESLGLSGEAAGGDPLFQLNHDQLKVDVGDASYYTLPEEKLLTIDDVVVVGSDAGGTITVSRDGDSLSLVFDGEVQGISSNAAGLPATLTVHIDVSCQR